MVGTATLVLAACGDVAPYKEVDNDQSYVTIERIYSHDEWLAIDFVTDNSIYVPTLTPTQVPVPTPTALVHSYSVGEWIDGWSTHYGESYNGGTLGCGTGYYSSNNPDIVAVSPYRYQEWPCGTVFEICGEGGCIFATRHDACPGCGANHLDLSESGSQAVCGYIASCKIRFKIVR